MIDIQSLKSPELPDPVCIDREFILPIQRKMLDIDSCRDLIRIEIAFALDEYSSDTLDITHLFRFFVNEFERVRLERFYVVDRFRVFTFVLLNPCLLLFARLLYDWLRGRQFLF